MSEEIEILKTIVNNLEKKVESLETALNTNSELYINNNNTIKTSFFLAFMVFFNNILRMFYPFLETLLIANPSPTSKISVSNI